MFDLLDKTLQTLLDDPQLGTSFLELFNADVSFVTPEKGFTFSQETVNLFLYEAKENRELRNPEPSFEQRNGMSIRRRPLLRVDCTYLVTAWSKQTGAAKVTAEHQLLGQALNWLSRFPEIPDPYLVAGGLAGQIFTPPTLVAQMDPVKNVGEFWTALGIAPRPFFNVVVTVEMDLDQVIDEHIVTTMITNTLQWDEPGSAETRFHIGGQVLDAAMPPQPVSHAWVELLNAAPATTRVKHIRADSNGCFVFADVNVGPYQLRASSQPQGTTAPRAIAVPEATGNYDLRF